MTTITAPSSVDTLLASRDLLGYPGSRIELHVDGRNLRVDIIDPVGVTTWVPNSRSEARDMYFHPFVYGYNAPNLLFDGLTDSGLIVR